LIHQRRRNNVHLAVDLTSRRHVPISIRPSTKVEWSCTKVQQIWTTVQ
jgi:hypothetical protein